MRQFVSERFGISLCRSSCLNWLHRLGFAFKRPKKRLVKGNESKREAFVAEYAREPAGTVYFLSSPSATASIAIERWGIGGRDGWGLICS